MTTDQHAPPPPEHEPPPSRRDQGSPAAGDQPCDCGGCQEFRAIHAGFSLEPTYGARLAKRERDRFVQRRLEELELDPARHRPSPAAEVA